MASSQTPSLAVQAEGEYQNVLDLEPAEQEARRQGSEVIARRIEDERPPRPRIFTGPGCMVVFEDAGTMTPDELADCARWLRKRADHLLNNAPYGRYRLGQVFRWPPEPL